MSSAKQDYREAYPFGARTHWPYKAWCKVQREILGGPPPPPAVPRTHTEAVARMLREFGGPGAKA